MSFLLRVNMSKLIQNSKLFEGYRNWVISNAEYLDSIENVSKVAIYLTLGKVDRSQLLTELCVTLTKLVSFLNDQIISNVLQKASPFTQNSTGTYRIKHMRIVLTIIEHVKVLLELTANKIFGFSGKSAVISLLLIFRSFVQFYLLFWEKLKLHEIAPLPPLDGKESLHNEAHKRTQPAIQCTLNSGRKICGIHCGDTSSASPDEARPQENTEANAIDLSFLGKALNFAKPLSHFALVTCIGNQSWVPWVAALTTDLLAISAVSRGHLTVLEEAYLVKWKLGLFMYLLRPPFFRKLTSIISPIMKRLRLFSPLLVYMVMQVLSLITEWQKIYFHVWD